MGAPLFWEGGAEAELGSHGACGLHGTDIQEPLISGCRSDALGHILPQLGKDWTHQGITSLYHKIHL